MTGKRKASDDAPGSSRPHPSQRGLETYDEGSTISDSSGDSRRTIPDEEGYSSFDVDDVGGGDSNERSEAAANMLLGLSLEMWSRVRTESSQSAAAEAQAHSPPAADHDQLAEMEVQPPPPPPPPPSPTDESVPGAEVSDHSVKAAAPEPELVASYAESFVCLACGREPAFMRLLPVKHACLCLLCLTDPSGTPHCDICDRPRR